MRAILDSDKKTLTVQIPADLVSTNAGELRDCLKEVLQTEEGRTVPWQTLRLEMFQAKMVDSVGLNLIVTILRATQKLQVRMQLAYQNPNVLRTLQFTRLDRHLDLVKA
ncbi:MAG TPA: STAS domain-containing protein [Verrucomicrobiae bacterium]